MPYKDPEQQKQYLHDHYETRKAFVIAAKQRPCADCGIEYPYYVMDFDHVSGEKEANLNRLRWSRSIPNLQKEIDKCDVVCSNCHRIRTFNRAGLSQ